MKISCAEGSEPILPRSIVSFADRVHCAVQTVSPNALEACAGLGRRPATQRVASGLRWGWRNQPRPAPPAPPARLAHVVRQLPARSGPLGLLTSGASTAAPGASEHVGTVAGGRRLCTACEMERVFVLILEEAEKPQEAGEKSCFNLIAQLQN